MSTCNVNQGEPVFDAPMGVQAYSFRKYFPKDLIGTLDRIRAMGITEIEGIPDKVDPDEFRRLCTERSMTNPSTGASFEELQEGPMKVVEAAKALGAEFVMCAWIPHPNRGEFSLSEADKAIEVFNKAGELLKENGLTFCYHLHGYEFQPYMDGTLMDYIIESTHPEKVSFEMDVFWAEFGGEDPVAMLKKYGERWKLLHLKDMKKGITKDLTGVTNVEYDVALGQGQLDIAGILKESRKIGIAHYFIEDESSSVMDQMPQSIDYLKSLKY